MVFPLNYCSCFNTNKALLRNLEYSAVANRLEKFCVHTIIKKKKKKVILWELSHNHLDPACQQDPSVETSTQLETKLPVDQAGFRKGQETRDIIANVRWILEKAKEYWKDIYMYVIDYSKAFDCVNHQKILAPLWSMGIAEHLVVLMHNLYNEEDAPVRMGKG